MVISEWAGKPFARQTSFRERKRELHEVVSCEPDGGGEGRGCYSLGWPIRGGSDRKEHLFQASGT